MAGLSRPSTSYLLHQPKTWMPGSPGMPNSVVLSTSRSSSGNTPALACCPVRREGPLTSLMRLLWGLIIVVVPTLALAGILLGKEARATGANSRSANAAPTVKPMIIPRDRRASCGTQAMQGRMHRADDEPIVRGIVDRHGQSLRCPRIRGRNAHFQFAQRGDAQVP